MEQIFVIASVWLGLAVVSAIIAYHLRISIALVESVWASRQAQSQLRSAKQRP